ncbi:MAG: Ig-like domain-containing protein [Exilispira sp.]
MKAKFYIILIIFLSLFLFSMQLCSLIFGSKPQVTITDPLNNATVSGTSLLVKGTIEDIDGDQKKVKVWIEDKNISGWDYDVSSGNFEVTLTLSGLENGQIYRIIAEGYDANGNTSDKSIVSFTYSSGAQNIIANGYFDKTGFVDNDIVYTDSTNISNYLNKTNGDYLPDWTFDIWTPEQTWPKIDLAIGSVRMYTTKSNSNGTQMYMKSSTITNFVTGSGKTIKISFKIDQYSGGTTQSPYYEAPVKIDIVIGDTRYTIAAFTTSSGYAEGGYLKANLAPNQQIIETFTLPETCLNGSSIPNGSAIANIIIWCHGWTWDVTIYSIEIY